MSCWFPSLREWICSLIVFIDLILYGTSIHMWNILFWDNTWTFVTLGIFVILPGRLGSDYYLIVDANGGLNQQRSSVRCLTLLFESYCEDCPTLDLNDFWISNSHDSFDMVIIFSTSSYSHDSFDMVIIFSTSSSSLLAKMNAHISISTSWP